MDYTDDYLMQLLPGNQYRILEKIGVGGCGTIYKAKQLSTGQIVVIKVSRPNNFLSKRLKKQILQQFEQEANICARINHPNIIQLIDKGFISEHEPFVVFEYIPGETLRNYLIRNITLSFNEMANLMGQVLQALVHAHDNGVVHGDLKPNNIMITQYGDQKYVKILDFGTGHFICNESMENRITFKTTNSPFVSPKYNAPEQLRGIPSSCKSDLYSWGLIVLECITGQATFSDLSMRNVYSSQLSAREIELPQLIQEHELGQLLCKVLKKDWSERCSDTRQVQKEFSNLDFTSLPHKLFVKPQIQILNTDNTILSERE